MAGALLAAGNADAEEIEAALHVGADAAAGVAEVGVAGVDQHVAVGELGGEHVGGFVDRRAGLHHDDDRARRRDGGDQILDV